MTAPLTKPCGVCNGSGAVARTPRPLIVDGVAAPDPFDTREIELCGRCNGSGAVPDPGPAGESAAAPDAGCSGCYC